LGLFYLFDLALTGIALPAITGPALWLLRINLILAVFNLIPGFPLDGGRVLRAVMWKLTGSEMKATRIATVSGQVVSYGFMAVGLFMAFTISVFNGIWLVFIGWFLGSMAKNSRAHFDMRQRLDGLTVSHLMNRHLATVPAQMSITSLVQDRIVPSGDRFFLVEWRQFRRSARRGHVEGASNRCPATSGTQPRWKMRWNRRRIWCTCRRKWR
jgi:hypothetical protein